MVNNVGNGKDGFVQYYYAMLSWNRKAIVVARRQLFWRSFTPFDL